MIIKKDIEELCKVISKIDSSKDCYDFLIDLCTPTELEALSDRWKAAQLLNQGYSYREIYSKTGVSTATITRVARSLKMGTGGYSQQLDSTSKKSKSYEK